MPTVTVDLRNVEGTEAAMGWAGNHTIVADRPDGKAGGRGLGFNGAQLLGLAIGGCFCNDLRYVAADMGVRLGKIAVRVDVQIEGDPIITTGATMNVTCEALDGADTDAVIERAKATCMVSNSISRGIPVDIRAVG